MGKLKLIGRPTYLIANVEHRSLKSSEWAGWVAASVIAEL